jgi:hypothetical protein
MLLLLPVEELSEPDRHLGQLQSWTWSCHPVL